MSWLQGHRRSVLFLIAVAVFAGVFAAIDLPVSLFPHIDFPRVMVTIEAGDRPVDRMVIEVTRPIEQAARLVPAVQGLRSISSRGSAELSVSFDWGADMVAAQLQIESAISRALLDLPSGTRYEVRRIDPTVFPILGLTLISPTRTPVAIRDFAEFQLRPLLTSITGVAHVDVLGGRLSEYQILVDPARLDASGLTVQDVADALAANNVITAVGRLEDRHRLYLTLVDNRLRSRDDIGHTLLKSGPRGAIELGDVAEIRDEVAPDWTRVTADGRDAVLVNVRQSPDVNAPALIKAVRRQLKEHAAGFPADIEIGSYYDQSRLVVAAARSVRDSILIGAVFAALILLLFLRDLRLTLIVAIVLPAVLAITALLLNLLGMSFNIMTLGGMAAAVGLIVDDAVVMVEHLARRLRERTADVVLDSLLPAAAEMIRPLTGSSAATVVIFVPLAFLSGIAGGFFKALALAMAVALVASFLIALLAVPVMTDRLLARRGHDPAAAQGAFARFSDRYERLARRSLEVPALAVIVALLLLIGGCVAYTRLPSGFIPRLDEGGFILDYRAAPGASLAETDRLLRQAELLIKGTPEVATYSRRTGLQLGGGLSEANEGDFFIRLKPLPRRAIEAVMAELRVEIETQVPGLTIETAQLIEDLIGDLTAVPQPVEVKLFGADTAELRSTASLVAGRLSQITGLVEVQDGLRVAGDALTVNVDRVRAAFEGMSPDAVTRQLETLVGGSIVGQIQNGERLVNIRLWSSAALRDRLEALSHLRLRAPDGHSLPLSRVADIRIDSGQPQITRENLEQMVPVTGRIEGRDLGSTMVDVRGAVAAMKLPKTVRVEFGGTYAEQQKSFRGLAAVFGAALLLVMTLLLYLYERWSVVVAILSTVMLSIAGVFIGLWLTGTELNISAIMGMTMIIGIVTELAIFYFAEIDTRAAPGHEALIRAGRLRLRPILMTTLISILALMPLALGLGAGSAMQTPLAIAIISGLVIALPLVLLLMPALYMRLAGLRD